LINSRVLVDRLINSATYQLDFRYHQRYQDEDKNQTRYRQRDPKKEVDDDTEVTGKADKEDADKETVEPKGRPFKDNKKNGKRTRVECEEGDPNCPL
jgi:hypothetical protein